jgi:predicted MFS family arabinose efflux permease
MKKIILLTIGMFALGLDAYVVAGLVPAIGMSFQANISAVGQTVTVFTLCYALSAPIFSMILSKQSIRYILLLAIMTFTIANAVSAVAPNLITLLVARAVAGIGAGLFSPIAAVAAVSLVPVEKKGRAISLILGGMSVGTVVGIPLGLLIAEYTKWQNTFWLVTLLGIVAMLGIYSKFPAFAAKTPPTIKERVAMLTHPKVAQVVAITLLTSIASLGLYTYSASVIHGNVKVNTIMPYLWAWGVGGIIGSFSIGALIDITKRPRQLMAIILIIMALSILLIPYLLQFPILGIAPFVLWGAMGWSSQAPQQHALHSIEPKHGAVVVALNSSANYLGSAIGAALGGLVIAAGILPAHLPYIAGSIAVLAFIGQIIINRRQDGGLVE